MSSMAPNTGDYTAEDMGEGMQERMHDDGRRLREQAVTIGRDVRELASTASEAAMHQMDPIEDYVRAPPLKSLLIAAGVGAVFGMIFFRR